VKALVTNRADEQLDQINYAQASFRDGKRSVADLSAAFTRKNSVNGKSDNPKSPFRGFFPNLRN
jgi:hypothetical protein